MGTAMNTDISNDAGLEAAGEATPTSQKGTVIRGRRGNEAYRPREYLTPKEIERLMAAARKRGRYGHRAETAILVTYRHRLPASELCAFRWEMVALKRGQLHVHRLKEGRPRVPPLEVLAIRPLP